MLSMAFTIPVSLVLIGYIRMKIYPFGDESLLNMDLWGQYFPMLIEQYSNRHYFLSNFFSWNGSAGFNIYAQSAYYCNSIFNFFLVLFRKENLINALDFLVLLKFGFSSLTFCMFLNYKYKKLNVLTVACSVAYSLCTYTIAYISQIMWFDAVIFLPIIIIGLEKMVFEKKPLLYCATLAISICSSFYISYSICLFLVLYFIAITINNSKQFSHKEIKEAMVNFVVFSLLAGGLAAFIVIPIYQAIGLTLASTVETPNKMEFYNTFAEYIAKLLPTTEISLEYGVPNIYSGSFVLVMIPLFFANTNILKRTKLVSLALIAFLFFSMNFNILNYVWHGFHFPNQLPGRWTFIFAFVLIMLSYETLINFEGINTNGILFALFNIILIIYLAKTVPLLNRVSNNMINFAVLSMIIFAIVVLYFATARTEKIREMLIVVLSVCIIAEMGINAVILLQRDVKTYSIKSYQHADETMSRIVSKYKSDANDFYRMEMYENWTFNPGQLYDYKGLSYYSSTMTGSAYNFFRNFGYWVYAKNVSTSYNPFSPVMNSLFSVKYLVDKNNGLILQDFEKIDAINNYGILENKYNLPFAFKADINLLKYKFIKGNPIKNQNSFFNAVVGREANVFTPITTESLNVMNATLKNDLNWDNQYYYRVDQKKPVKFLYSYKTENDQYLYFQQNYRKGEMTVKINKNEQKIRVDSEVIKSLGFVKAGTDIEVSLVVDDVDIGLWGLELYSFNVDRFEECYKELNKNTVKNIEFKNTKIICTVDLEEDGLLYTSIPNDGGWKVKCDGKNIGINKIGDYFIGIMLPAGNHRLEFTYHVPGLRLGIIISLLSLSLIVVIVYLRKFIRDSLKMISTKNANESRNGENP